MKKRLLRFFLLWFSLLIYMAVARAVFVFIEPVYHLGDLGNVPVIMWHALPMDLSMSAYLMIIPGLLLIASVWTRRNVLKMISAGYLWFVAFLLGFTTVLDAALFPYWNFRLDSTPFFYFFTSPGSAMASLPFWAEGLLI
ncbi:MAG: LTA synthase family protein, partial [Muribaculaceae bacterium]|nr:LTA synthase family protein [Muribaculaceae bacterium]